MAKIQTRTEKFKEYREEIKREEDVVEPVKIETSTKPLETKSLFKSNHNESKDVPLNKHIYQQEEKKEPCREKTIYDEYIRKRRIKRFFYVLFVLIIASALISVSIYFISTYTG